MKAILRYSQYIECRKMWALVVLRRMLTCYVSSIMNDHCAFIYMSKQCNRNYLPSDIATHPKELNLQQH
jgi:hypothetical protein